MIITQLMQYSQKLLNLAKKHLTYLIIICAHYALHCAQDYFKTTPVFHYLRLDFMSLFSINMYML